MIFVKIVINLYPTRETDFLTDLVGNIFACFRLLVELFIIYDIHMLFRPVWNGDHPGAGRGRGGQAGHQGGCTRVCRQVSPL